MASSDAALPVTAGAVYLVGAGPGSVGLLTVRAVEVLSFCDVVLHDRLVSPEIVRLAKASSDVRYVGKDAGVSTEKMKGQQDDISGQLVALARQGLSVCRLKGGDPMIFGRVGEEMEELANAGVPFEIVPAVTAALAAGADARVPLTFRKLSTSLHIHTMNASTTKDAAFDWKQFAAPSQTHALYMGLGVCGDVCSHLRAAGVPGNMPMAVVDRASMPAMQVVAGTVDTLPALVQGRDDLQGPAMCILGEVVALRERLSGSSPPAPPAPDAALVASLAALPALGEAALRTLRARIDDLLAQRDDSSEQQPPAKRLAVR